MRGTAPLLVAAISVIFLGDRLSPLAWLGIGVICLLIFGENHFMLPALLIVSAILLLFQRKENLA